MPLFHIGREVSKLISGVTGQVYQIFARYIGVISAVNALIDIAIFQSILECQCAELRSDSQFGPKLVAIAKSLELSEKEGRIVPSQ